MNHLLKNILITLFCWISILSGQTFTIARIHYGGGGDWYGNPSSLPNLLTYIQQNTSILVEEKEVRVQLTDPDLYSHPYLYLTGHGNIRFSEDEVGILRSFLLNGGFLHADDNYGMDVPFRREMKRVFPDKEWVELPAEHEIYNSFYSFPDGLPKVHEHNGKRPQGLGLFDEERLIAFYSYESDLGDGWEDSTVHNNPWNIREAAFQMGVNIVWFALTQ